MSVSLSEKKQKLLFNVKYGILAVSFAIYFSIFQLLGTRDHEAVKKSLEAVVIPKFVPKSGNNLMHIIFIIIIFSKLYNMHLYNAF